jgi:hypothetical protein
MPIVSSVWIFLNDSLNVAIKANILDEIGDSHIGQVPLRDV